MRDVQSPNKYGLDPILRARSGEEPAMKREGSIGVSAKNVNSSSNVNILDMKSDSSLESIGVFEGFHNHNQSSTANIAPIVDEYRTSGILGSSSNTFDDNATNTSEKRKVRWGPSTKAPQHGCGINSSGAIQFADLYKGIVDISSTLGKNAKKLGDRIEVMGMTCASEGQVLRGECSNAFDAVCGDNVGDGENMGGCRYTVEEDNSLIYSSNHCGEGGLFKRDATTEKRDAIKESRDALDSYDNMRESRQCFDEPRCGFNDGTSFITQGNRVATPSQHFTFSEYDGSRTNQNDVVASSRRVATREKAQRSYFYSSSSNRASMNNIETGMGATVNMMSPTFHRSPRVSGIDSPANNNTKMSPVSILKKNQGRYASSGTSTFPTTTGDARVKLRKSPRASNYSGKSPRPTSSMTTATLPARGKKKSSSSRRVLGGLMKKSLKLMTIGTKSQLKNSYPKSALAIGACPSPRHSQC